MRESCRELAAQAGSCPGIFVDPMHTSSQSAHGAGVFATNWSSLLQGRKAL